MASPVSLIPKRRQLLWKKLGFVGVIVVLLWFIGDESFTVFTALQQHEPSERIFRSMLQVNLLIWATAFSLYVWSKIVPAAVLGELLFQPPPVISSTPAGFRTNSATTTGTRRIYQPVVTAADDDIVIGVENVSDTSSHSRRSSHRLDDDDVRLDDGPDGDAEEPMDAHYESDGEVEEPNLKVEIPSVVSVMSAACDMLLVILVALFLFTISAAGYTSSIQPLQLVLQVAAPTFALVLFLYLVIASVLPWKKRSAFWIIVSLTPTAPWHDVTFRDGFIGDIITSSVRPLQDIAFTTMYLLSGLRGWWSQDYHNNSFLDNADASVPEMERSWLMHTVILPMCMVSPLWWRFLQNLRQTFDNKKRWPYLGNGLKYFVAAQVAVFGVFHPELQKTAGWLSSFVIATLYQIWWDVFMDWELIERDNQGRWRLRRRRLYSRKSFYWAMCIVNIILRFCWTLTFVPSRYLNATGVLKQNSLQLILGPTIASLEIVRRALWGLLRFELEAIKHLPDREMSAASSPSLKKMSDDMEDGMIELTPMTVTTGASTPIGSLRTKFTSDMSSMNDVQILGELSVYATLFCIIGTVAAAHRGTL